MTWVLPLALVTALVTPPAVELFRRLCRYYYFLEPEAAAYYVRSYCEMWDNSETAPTSTPD